MPDEWHSVNALGSFTDRVGERQWRRRRAPAAIRSPELVSDRNLQSATLSTASDPTAAAMPSGTVTFLFTDIEGSTQRWESDPVAMRQALAEHDAVLRSVIAVHAGALFKHTGDGVCAAFTSVADAIAAAIEAQRRLALPVRMGIATGEVEAQGSTTSIRR